MDNPHIDRLEGDRKMFDFDRFVTLAERLGKVASSLSNLALSICVLILIYSMFISA